MIHSINLLYVPLFKSFLAILENKRQPVELINRPDRKQHSVKLSWSACSEREMLAAGAYIISFCLMQTTPFELVYPQVFLENFKNNFQTKKTNQLLTQKDLLILKLTIQILIDTSLAFYNVEQEQDENIATILAFLRKLLVFLDLPLYDLIDSTNNESCLQHAKIYYTYRLTCPKIEQNGEAIYYMGYRGSYKLPKYDEYYSSSKTVTKIVKDYGKNNITKKILGIYATQTEATSQETYYHLRLQVEKNPKFLNLARQTSTAFYYDNTGRTQTAESNVLRSAALTGKPKHTPESKQKIANYQKTGRVRTDEELTKLSESAKKRNATIVVCPYCGKEGQCTAMKKWHFENCLQAPNPSAKALEQREKMRQKAIERNKKKD